jgi:hypothetical protein
MTERSTKSNAGTKRDLTTKNEPTIRSEPDTQGAVDRLEQVLDELRSSVVSLTDRVGEGLVAAGGRGLQQARQMAGDVAEDVADRATEGMAAIRSRVQDQSPAVIVLAFFAGAILGGLIGASSVNRPRHWPDKRPSGRR